MLKEWYLFSIKDKKLEKDLNNGTIPKKLKDRLKAKVISLSENITVTKKNDEEWTIIDEENENTYFIRKRDRKLNVYSEEIQVSDKEIKNELEKILKVTWTYTYERIFNDMEKRLKGKDVRNEVNSLKDTIRDFYARNRGINLWVLLQCGFSNMYKKKLEEISKSLVEQRAPSEAREIIPKYGHIYMASAVIIDD